MRGRGFALALSVLLFGAAIRAAESYPTFTDATKAGPDFQVQGEFVGLLGGERPVAAQVIALGGGHFEGIVYRGGLPGAGWDGSVRSYIRGETKDGRTRFTGIFGERLKFHNPNFQGVIEDGIFGGSDQSFRNVSQDVSFELEKVDRRSPTLGATAPTGAIVLFDGPDTSEWTDGELVEGNLLKWGTTTKREFKSVRLHLEFRCPFMPTARGMHRGNSGVYVKNEWEIQIVDSFGWTTENRKFERLSHFARAGGIHEMVQPRLNMSFPPLSWQTYDVEFTAARFDNSGKKAAPAMMSLWHNGVSIHDKYILPPVPPGRNLSESTEGFPGRLYLQDHGNPVAFRNVWVVEKN